ncbi:ABC transporter ATP-binding protein [Cysteiniphilum litorale]|uniref:ABC transporter ATP-binding protein n=1 Tax=Cysteiniphilum litorale TaxID=2056700 RepID=UPI003F88268A
MLQVKELSYQVKESTIFSQLNFELRQGESLALLGKSGCGKTTILKCIAGVLAAKSGQISLKNQLLSDKGHTLVPSHKRNIGMIFQDYALFPHMSVFDNIAFGMSKQITNNKSWQEKKEEKKAEISSLIGLVHLPESLLARYPHELSGGQKQRVAIARTLASKPQLVLLDEPFSNIDSEVRLSLLSDIKTLFKKRNISSILVTHSTSEAFNFADRVAIMENGRIAQLDKPFDLYHAPATASIARLISDGVLISAKVNQRERLQSAIGEINVNQSFDSCDYQMFVRPDAIEILHSEECSENIFTAKVIDCQFNNGRFDLILICHQTRLVAHHHLPMTLDMECLFKLHANKLVLIPDRV